MRQQLPRTTTSSSLRSAVPGTSPATREAWPIREQLKQLSRPSKDGPRLGLQPALINVEKPRRLLTSGARLKAAQGQLVVSASPFAGTRDTYKDTWYQCGGSIVEGNRWGL